MRMLTRQSSTTSYQKKRNFIPDDHKDFRYWLKRQRNNEAARKSREKRRVSDRALEFQVNKLTCENHKLKDELRAIKKRTVFGGNESICTTTTDADSNSNSSPPLESTIEYSPLKREQFMQPVPVQSPQGHQPTVLKKLSSKLGRPASTKSSLSTTSLHQAKCTPLRIPEYQPTFSSSSHSTKVSTLSKTPSHNDSITLLSPESKPIHKIPATANDISLREKQKLLMNTTKNYNSIGQLQCLPNPLGKEYSTYDLLLSGEASDDTYTVSPNKEIVALNMTGQHSCTSVDQSFERARMAKVFAKFPIQHGQTAMSHSPSPSHFAINDMSADTLEIKQEDISATDSESYDFNQAMQNRSIPHKLRHKTCLWGDRTSYGQSTEEQAASSSSSRSVNFPIIQNKYIERRNKNNLAAKKCRDNRRQMNDMTQQKAKLLEKENDQLRKELSFLGKEIMILRAFLHKTGSNIN